MLISPKKVAFALTTFYPKWYEGNLKSISDIDKVRGDLALEFIQKVISLGFQVVIVDGTSSKQFQKELKTFYKSKIFQRQGNKRAPAKRLTLETASKLVEVKALILCEAEKISLLDSVELIAKPILENAADIVLPKRENNLFRKTYPDYMYKSEMKGNRLYNAQLNTDFDWFFGPRVLANKSKILSLFTHRFKQKQKSVLEYYDPEQLSNILFFPVISALKLGFKVSSIEIPFSYPPLQKMNEAVGTKEFFTKKRIAQREGLLSQLKVFLDLSIHNRY